MLVRRIATLTICAPETSIASPVCAKSRYLPVPPRRRDQKLLPPMTGASFLSFASDRVHDLELVAVGDPGARVHALRHDLPVALDRDLLARKKHFLEQGAERERLLEALRRTVDGDLNHGRILLPISTAK